MNPLIQFAIKLALLGTIMTLAGCLSSGDDSALVAKSDPPPLADPPPPPPPAANRAPTISGVPGSSVLMGEEYSFTPDAADADNDPLTFSVQGEPDWLAIDSGNGTLAGTPQLADIGSYSGIVVSVSDGSLSASLPQFSVDVVQNADGTITLSWTAPTQNEDGTALTDLDAYKIYYGTTPGNYSNQVRIDNGGLTSYVLDNLTPATYYIVATAINSGGLESAFSSEISKQVP